MILIINRKKAGAEAVAEMFRYMGILAYAANHTEALSEISELYRAVLIMNPDTLPDPKDFTDKLRSYARAVPIFAFYDEKENTRFNFFDAQFPFAIYSSSLAEKIIECSKKRGLSPIGDYRLAGINASCDIPEVTYCDYAFALTKTESLIVKYLIRSYPRGVMASDILTYCYKASKAPEASSIRTHISLINKKFRKISGRSLIAYITDEGYILCTPEVKNKYNLQ